MDEAHRLRAEDDGLATIVIGLPRRLNGEATTLTGQVRQFASIDHRTPLTCPIVLQDERLTSSEADELLARRERDWRRRKRSVDAVAAALILQDYLDSHRPVAASSDDDLA